MSLHRSLSLIIASALVACFCGGCAQQQPAAPADTRATDEGAVRKADADWSQAAQAKQADAWIAFYSDDAVVLPPNDRTATTKDSIRKAIGDLLALPGLSLNWQTSKVEVARSGDFAYSYGTYDLTSTNAKGKPMRDHGKYVEIWKKQSDGSWKCALDTWNSDLAAPPSK